MMRWIKSGLLLSVLCCSFSSLAVNVSDMNVANAKNNAKVTLSFAGKPIYGFFPLHNPERMVLDIRQSAALKGLPLNFSGNNLVKRIRTSTPKDKQSIRLVFELAEPGTGKAVVQQNGRQYRLLLTINGTPSTSSKSQPVSQQTSRTVQTSAPATTVRSHQTTVRQAEKVIVAIDAGHGGQDPGASGASGLKEKNVTIAIARKLRVLLNKDPMFHPVMTRDGDYFIPVSGRSDVARKKDANFLVSIHADAAPDRSARGASVWVLSNRRANSEMAGWLEQHEKQSDLLGGAGDLLANNQADPYLSQAVLDLQFGHSQRVGYDVAVNIISQLKHVGRLHKRLPEHASLGVLRSPDIPSLLVETGFISNPAEEKLLGSSAYQQKLAEAIHQGLRSYFRAHPLLSLPTQENRPVQSAAVNYTGAVQRHVVKPGETLSGIAAQYGVSMATLRSLNTLKKDGVWVGQRLKVPASGATQIASAAKSRKPQRHKVVRGDTLTEIAAKYGVSAKAIQQANKMKTQNVMLGQTLTIPAS